MEPQLATSSPQSTPALPSSEELQAELLDIPEPPDMPPAVTPPGYEDALAGAVKYVRAKRGGDLVGIILVGSGARRAVTAHSDIDLIALVKGPADGQEMIRVGDRLVDIRYGDHKTVAEDLAYSPRPCCARGESCSTTRRLRHKSSPRPHNGSGRGRLQPAFTSASASRRSVCTGWAKSRTSAINPTRHNISCNCSLKTA